MVFPHLLCLLLPTAHPLLDNPCWEMLVKVLTLMLLLKLNLNWYDDWPVLSSCRV